jgi:hypothetical protein
VPVAGLYSSALDSGLKFATAPFALLRTWQARPRPALSGPRPGVSGRAAAANDVKRASRRYSRLDDAAGFQDWPACRGWSRRHRAVAALPLRRCSLSFSPQAISSGCAAPCGGSGARCWLSAVRAPGRRPAKTPIRFLNGPCGRSVQLGHRKVPGRNRRASRRQGVRLHPARIQTSPACPARRELPGGSGRSTW